MFSLQAAANVANSRNLSCRDWGFGAETCRLKAGLQRPSADFLLQAFQQTYCVTDIGLLLHAVMCDFPLDRQRPSYRTT